MRYHFHRRFVRSIPVAATSSATSAAMAGSIYGASRLEGFPAMFAEQRTPVTADTVEAGWIFAFGILLLSFLAILPAYKGKRVSRRISYQLGTYKTL